MRSRLREFAIGVAIPVPFLALVAVVFWIVFNVAQASDAGLGFLFLVIAGCVVAQIALAVRSWNRSRWRAYGILSSFLVLAAVGGIFALVVMLAIGGAMRG